MSEAQPVRRRRRRFLLWLFAGLLVALLACWIATLVLVARAESAFPRHGQLVRVEGLQQHYLDRGPRGGPPIVLVHGAFGASQDFAATVLESLSAEYRCIVWDRPGHGYSERPHREIADPGVQARVLLSLCAELRLDRPLLVGFSYGAAVALAAALQTDALRGVVMLNGPSHWWPDPTRFEYRLPEWPFVGWLATETVITPLGALLSGPGVGHVFAPEPVAERFETHSPLPLALRPASFRANAEDIRVLKSFFKRAEPEYAKVAVPVTMLVSEGDKVVSPTLHSSQLEKVVKRFSMVRLEGAGHQVLYSQTEVVLRLIRKAATGE